MANIQNYSSWWCLIHPFESWWYKDTILKICQEQMSEKIKQKNSLQPGPPPHHSQHLQLFRPGDFVGNYAPTFDAFN